MYDHDNDDTRPIEPRTVAVIGAGIIGVSTAIWAQRAGHRVILIDKQGPAAGASFGNGGVLASCAMVPLTTPDILLKAPRMVLHPNEPLFVKWAYLPRMLPWLFKYLKTATAKECKRIAAGLMPIVGDSLNDHQALATGTGAARWVVASDYLYLYRDRAQYTEDAFSWSLRRDHGFEWEELDRAAVQDYDPIFAPSIGFAVRMGQHGHVTDPARYVQDLAGHVALNGGKCLTGEVEYVVHEQGRVTGVRMAGESIACDAAVITAGVWSGSLAAQLGLSLPLESERGYHLDLFAASHMPKAPVMITTGKFVATPMAGRLRLAGILEFGGLDASASQKPVAFLERQIKQAIPGISWKYCESWMGHRPALTDSLPVIGEHPAIAGVFLGFGHHHIGLTGGPKTGRILAQLISGAHPNIDISPYNPARF